MLECDFTDSANLIERDVQYVQRPQIRGKLLELLEAIVREIEYPQVVESLQPLLRQQLQLVDAQIEREQVRQAAKGARRDPGDAVDAEVDVQQHGEVLEVLAGDDSQVGRTDVYLLESGVAMGGGDVVDAHQGVAGQVEPRQARKGVLGERGVRYLSEPVPGEIHSAHQGRVMKEVGR
jgi:hypothetical protein